MFRAMIPPIFRSTRLCVTVCGIMHPPRCCRPPAGNIVGEFTTSCNTQSTAPEDGRDHRPKHIELIGIINKPLLLHLVGCLYYLNYLSFIEGRHVNSNDWVTLILSLGVPDVRRWVTVKVSEAYSASISRTACLHYIKYKLWLFFKQPH